MLTYAFNLAAGAFVHVILARRKVESSACQHRDKDAMHQTGSSEVQGMAMWFNLELVVNSFHSSEKQPQLRNYFRLDWYHNEVVAM